MRSLERESVETRRKTTKGRTPKKIHIGDQENKRL